MHNQSVKMTLHAHTCSTFIHTHTHTHTHTHLVAGTYHPVDLEGLNGLVNGEFITAVDSDLPIVVLIVAKLELAPSQTRTNLLKPCTWKISAQHLIFALHGFAAGVVWPNNIK